MNAAASWSIDTLRRLNDAGPFGSELLRAGYPGMAGGKNPTSCAAPRRFMGLNQAYQVRRTKPVAALQEASAPLPAA
jgi:hypothetical protein